MVRAELAWQRAVVECIPNFSEGRDPAVMDAIEAEARGVRGTVVLDRHADPVHNRMVLTFAGSPGAVAEAAFRCVRRAAELIDMETQRGVHPRIGATDVLPFVPIGSTPMAVCQDLATRVGARIAAELDIPVYLYARSARRPGRVRLPDVRRGEYEGLRDAVAVDPGRAPDFGPTRVGRAGATAVGARGFLVAYNVTIATPDLGVVKAIARTIRERDGGLPAVQALGFPTADPSVQQVSLNLLDIARTPVRVVFERIVAEAAQHGAEVLASELVGLAPAAFATETAGHTLKLPGFAPGHLVETRLVEALLEAQS